MWWRLPWCRFWWPSLLISHHHALHVTWPCYLGASRSQHFVLWMITVPINLIPWSKGVRWPLHILIPKCTRYRNCVVTLNNRTISNTLSIHPQLISVVFSYLSLILSSPFNTNAIFLCQYIFEKLNHMNHTQNILYILIPWDRFPEAVRFHGVANLFQPGSFSHILLSPLDTFLTFYLNYCWSWPVGLPWMQVLPGGHLIVTTHVCTWGAQEGWSDRSNITGSEEQTGLEWGSPDPS